MEKRPSPFSLRLSFEQRARLERESRGQVMTALTRLRTAGEVQEQTDRDWSAQIVLRAGKTPLLLKRVMYDRDFRSDEFSSDPDHPEKRWIDRIRWRRKPSPDQNEQMRSSSK